MAGIYIHIPFCKQACTYCNFHFSTSLKQKEAFINALLKEIKSFQPEAEDSLPVETIYFGGGTPSLLSQTEINKIFAALKDRFLFAADAEITLEANPDDINPEKLNMWKNAGINRLSIGLQSFDEVELKWMNRAHNAAEAYKTLDLIKDAGFSNYSIDLIYGSNLQTTEILKHNLETLTRAGVPHISAYALTVEPKTALQHFIKIHKEAPVNTDKQAEQYEILMDHLLANGYEAYEISNFSKPGFRSRHNSGYWQEKPYYGFGPSAHGYNGNNRRSWNVANNTIYIDALENDKPFWEAEILNETQQLNEYIMIAMRLMEGIAINQIENKFGEKISLQLIKKAEKFLQEELLILENKHLKLTRKGRFLADGIAADLFF